MVTAAYRRGTSMLDEAARARLRGLFMSDSSAAPGRADADDDLVDLVDEFYNGYDQQGMGGGVVVAKDGRAPRSSEWKHKLREILAADVAAARIRAEAERVVRDAAAVDNTGGGVGVSRKRLVERLRASRFNAGNNNSGGRGDVRRGAGLHLAPWRRARYVQAKWSAKYERVGVVAPVATAGDGMMGQEAVTTVSRAVQAAAASEARSAGQEAGARPVVHARRSGGRKNCGMEMGCRELAMGREALMNVRPLFRGM
ncbi:hypothetical protein QOZ80_2BG0199020 [Eleusine coracana subsp. coracana]|nr:hypothetical protein QOZ80_2BG0199020 [Eleusine coracana subsp. coracana]